MNAEFIEQMEAFLDGRLSRRELEQQAQTLGINNLEQELQWLRDSRTAIEAAGLRAQLQEALPQSGTAKIRQLRPMRRVLAIAASILVLVLAYVFVFQDSTPALYAEYEFVDPGLPVLMSQSEQHQLYDALSYYSEANYAVAADKLRQLQPQLQSDTLLYYLGASELYLGHPQAAEQSLKALLAMANSGFQERAQWLWVLAALRAENEAVAKDRLKVILQNPEHLFLESAQLLQQALD